MKRANVYEQRNLPGVRWCFEGFSVMGPRYDLVCYDDGFATWREAYNAACEWVLS